MNRKSAAKKKIPLTVRLDPPYAKFLKQKRGVSQVRVLQFALDVAGKEINKNFPVVIRMSGKKPGAIALSQ